MSSVGLSPCRAFWRVAAVLLLAVTPALDASVIEGRLQLLVKRGDRESRTARPPEAVVYFVPAVAEDPPPSGSYTIVTRNKQFNPRLLIVAQGSTVRFPNEDPILHNVFSVSGDNAFDLGLYNQGPGKEVIFSRPGTVRVYCNVHKAMATYVLVLGTRYWQQPDEEGRFRLAGLPAGAGTLYVWHERADPLEVEVSLDGGTLRRNLALRITKPRIPAHLDKEGRSYEGRGRDYR